MKLLLRSLPLLLALVVVLSIFLVLPVDSFAAETEVLTDWDLFFKHSLFCVERSLGSSGISYNTSYPTVLPGHYMLFNSDGSFTYFSQINVTLSSDKVVSVHGVYESGDTFLIVDKNKVYHSSFLASFGDNFNPYFYAVSKFAASNISTIIFDPSGSLFSAFVGSGSSLMLTPYGISVTFGSNEVLNFSTSSFVIDGLVGSLDGSSFISVPADHSLLTLSSGSYRISGSGDFDPSFGSFEVRYTFSVLSSTGSSLFNASSTSAPTSLKVTSSGASVSFADGSSQTYTYSGEDYFLGFSASPGGDLTYVPGSTYSLSGIDLSVYMVDAPSYDVGIYDSSGGLLFSYSSLDPPLSFSVSNSGITITYSSGSTKSYTYAGDQIFIGFSSAAGSDVSYVPGNTYPFTGESLMLYVSEKVPCITSLYLPDGSAAFSLRQISPAVSIQVTSSGALITFQDGTSRTFSYSGSDYFTGLASSSDAAAEYLPGNTYDLTGNDHRFYVITQRIYHVTIFDTSGSKVFSQDSIHYLASIDVTGAGALFTFSDGTNYLYSYSGKECFTGFALSSSGDPSYVADESYTPDPDDFTLYARYLPYYTYILSGLDGEAFEIVKHTVPMTSFQVTNLGCVLHFSDGTSIVWTYPGTNKFQGFATRLQSDPVYLPGNSYDISPSRQLTFYTGAFPVILDRSQLDSILDVFLSVSSLIVSAMPGLVTLFYDPESGLTLVGVLAVLPFAFSVSFFIINLIKSWLSFRSK